jgi:hypothetical protein
MGRIRKRHPPNKTRSATSERGKNQTLLDSYLRPASLDNNGIEMERSHSTDARQTLKDSVNQARSIINSVQDMTTVDQKAGIRKAIQLLYTYGPREGQLDALHHLIYSGNFGRTSF